MTLCLRHHAVQAVIDLPWSLYSTFVLEQRHGFNQTTPRTYVADMLKTVRRLLTAILRAAQLPHSPCLHHQRHVQVEVPYQTRGSSMMGHFTSAVLLVLRQWCVFCSGLWG